MIDDPRLPARFWRKVIPEPNTGCWLWTGCQSTAYGRYHVANMAMRPAHRVAYTALVGPIPKGLELDHRCCTPACVNPQHLDPVTSAENVRRASLRRNPPQRVRAALEGHHWNKTRAARALGINRHTMARLVARYQIARTG